MLKYNVTMHRRDNHPNCDIYLRNGTECIWEQYDVPPYVAHILFDAVIEVAKVVSQTTTFEVTFEFEHGKKGENPPKH